MERGSDKQQIGSFGLKEFLLLEAKLLPFVIGMLEFSPAMRHFVRKEQHYRCDNCHVKVDEGHKLEIHHKVPRSHGGSDKRQNAVGLCHTCHTLYDRLALEEHKYYDDINGEVRLSGISQVNESNQG